MGEKAPEISSLSFEEALKELEALSCKKKLLTDRSSGLVLSVSKISD